MSELHEYSKASTSGFWPADTETAARRRRRASSASSSASTNHTDKEEQDQDQEQEQERGISVLDIIRVIVSLVIASCSLSYYMTSSESLLWGYRPWFTRWPMVVAYMRGPVNLTPAQLSLYNGTDPSLPIYLAVNGSIFDVSANPVVYGPGGSYHFFAGRDATRAFVTGCFAEDLTPDLVGVEEMFVPVDDVDDEDISPAQRKTRRERERRLARSSVEKTVRKWESFFRDHKRYFQVGRVVQDDDYGDPDAGKRRLCESAQRQRPKRSQMES